MKNLHSIQLYDDQMLANIWYIIDFHKYRARIKDGKCQWAGSLDNNWRELGPYDLKTGISHWLKNNRPEPSIHKLENEELT